jgi:general secretion pathway protein K
MYAPWRPRRERGFALLLVLWVLVLLSAVAIHLSASGRTGLALARNTLDAAKAEALADSAIVSALYNVMEPEPAWKANGEQRTLIFPEGSAVVVVEDEDAKINPNLVDQALLVELFAALGVSRREAESAAAALIKHRANLIQTRLSAAKETTASATPRRPVRAFDGAEDLRDIEGVPPQLAAAALPHFSVFTVRSEPTLEHASAVVRKAATGRVGGGHRAPVVDWMNEADGAAAPRTTVRVVVRAATTGGASFAREAIARIDRELPAGYAVMLWRRGAADPLAHGL